MNTLLKVLTCAALSGLLLVTYAGAQEQDGLPDDHSPRGALWRAAAIPGWGQLYNRQVYKVPIVYAGLGGLAASAIVVNRRYLLYRHSYLFLARQEDFPHYESDY
ncbi:MAG: DUF5683 domain-containing protein, partial [Rhodothermales bacterium]